MHSFYMQHTFVEVAMVSSKNIRVIHYLFPFVLLLTLTTVASAQIKWISSYDQALNTSKDAQKPLLLYFHTPTARLCVRYQQETFTQPQVIKFLNENIVCYAVNAEREKQLVVKYGVYRVPTVLILDPTGKEFLRILTFYPADKLLESLGNISQTMSNRAAQPVTPQTKPLNYAQAIFYEPFESLRGWGNEGSTEGSTAQISLVKGVRGNAFRIDYELMRDVHNYIQVHRQLEPTERVNLSGQFTVIFHVAGTGAQNKLDLKFADADGTNYGTVLDIPVDGKGHRVILTSDEIKYLWGGNDQKLDTFLVLLLAVSPKDALNPQIPDGGKGALFIDELVILPGIYR